MRSPLATKQEAKHDRVENLGPANIDDNPIDREGWAPLHKAAAAGEIKSIFSLLEHHADLNLVTNDSAENNILHLAGTYGHLSLVTTCVQKFKMDPLVMNKQGSALIHLAAREGHNEIVRYCLNDLKLDKNIVENNDWAENILHAAAGGNHLALVKELVEDFHMDFNIHNDKGYSALHIAIENGGLETILYFLHRVSLNPQLDIATLRTKNGDTLLHLAVGADNFELFQCLLEKYGMNCKLKNNDEVQPVHNAAILGHKNFLLYLLKNDVVSVDAKDRQGRTPLHYAATNKHYEIIKILVEDFKADPHVVTLDGYNALAYSIFSGDLRTFRYLIDSCKVTPLQVGLKNHNALSMAIIFERVDIATYLKENFPSLTDFQPDRNHKHLMHHLAEQGKWYGIIFLLKNQYSDLVADGHNNAPFVLALENKQITSILALYRPSYELIKGYLYRCFSKLTYSHQLRLIHCILAYHDSPSMWAKVLEKNFGYQIPDPIIHIAKEQRKIMDLNQRKYDLAIRTIYKAEMKDPKIKSLIDNLLPDGPNFSNIMQFKYIEILLISIVCKHFTLLKLLSKNIGPNRDPRFMLSNLSNKAAVSILQFIEPEPYLPQTSVTRVLSSFFSGKTQLLFWENLNSTLENDFQRESAELKKDRNQETGEPTNKKART